MTFKATREPQVNVDVRDWKDWKVTAVSLDFKERMGVLDL